MILPIVILLLMAMFDFGRAVFAYNSVSEAARNGARVAIVNQTPADICAVAAERAVGLGLPTSCVGVTTPPTPGISVEASSGGQSCTAYATCSQRVRATYEFTAITPIIGNIIGPIRLTSESELTVESLCLNNNCPRT